MAFVFGALMLLGVLYLLLMIFSGLGHAIDMDVDGALDKSGLSAVFGLDKTAADEASGLGCSVIAAFLAGFGAVGLTGTLLDWPLPLILIAALVVGVLLGRGVARALRFVYAQQSTAVYANEELIGQFARVTINSAAGKTGEALVEGDHILKFPIREVGGAELRRGDTVEIVDVQGRFLLVKKKRGG
jgi:membrane protein implicated in regulation of membrane protease activity